MFLFLPEENKVLNDDLAFFALSAPVRFSTVLLSMYEWNEGGLVWFGAAMENEMVVCLNDDKDLVHREIGVEDDTFAMGVDDELQ